MTFAAINEPLLSYLVHDLGHAGPGCLPAGGLSTDRAGPDARGIIPGLRPMPAERITGVSHDLPHPNPWAPDLLK